MVCCCRRYLRKFAPVAIKMAKEQNVFLNPVKISGICGRLLCCLAYEQEHYDEFYRSCPKLGKKYQTDAGIVRVLRASLFHESVTVLSEAGEEVEYPLAEWNGLNPVRPGAQQPAQAPRKQEAPGNEGRQQKEKDTGRNHRDPREGKEAFSGAVPAPERNGGGVTENEAGSPVFFAKKEQAVGMEHGGGLPEERSHGVAAAMPEPEPEDMDDDGVVDDGGSIFGLAPGRSVAASGDNAAKADRRPDRAGEGGARRKRPRRRKPHSGTATES
jgi:hypothetical protein